jgi:hypothetical protein
MQSQNASGGPVGFIPIGISVVVFFVVWYGFAYAEPPIIFLRALRDGDDRKAFALLTESAQSDVGGYEEFQVWADVVRPQRWFMGSSCGNSHEGRSDGSVRLADNVRSSLSFSTVVEDEQWKIAGIHIWEADPSYWVGRGSGMDCSD